MRKFSILIALFCFSKIGISQTDNRILNDDEMTKTCQMAISLIKSNDYPGFKNLFPEEVSRQDAQLFGFFNFIRNFINKEGVPAKEDIQVRLTKKLSGADTIYINVIAFMYRNPDNNINPFDKELTFSFLAKYGTGTIAAINYSANPLNAQGIAIKINKLDSFILNNQDIKLYRVFYEEGKNKKTTFGKNKGAFALDGDRVISVQSKIDPIFEQIFRELRKVKIDKVEEFRTALNTGKDTEYIKTIFTFENLSYGILIYLPITTDPNYKDKILIQQLQGANLGYQYYVEAKNNDVLVSLLKSIIKINWGSYYSEEL